MKSFLLLIPLLLFSTIAFAQVESDTISFEQYFGGKAYFQNGEKIGLKDMLEIMEDNQEAYQLMKSGRTNFAWANVFAALGGGFIGWPLGTAIAGGDPEWALAGIGVALIGVGIPLSLKADKQINEAISIYNSSLGVDSRNPVRLNMEMTENGFGLVMRF